tara:strand:+ start:2312 stop:2848 length:537 start_codon:yes stop_codon:yes gene_type:complete
MAYSMRMNKEIAIFNGIIRNYFPNIAKAVDNGEADPEDFNIERLFEKCIAKESGLTWANEEGEAYEKYDLVEDKSDAKTSSVSLRWNVDKRLPEGGCDVVTGTISNTGGKEGDLRVVVYNSYIQKLDYFLIPHKHISEFQKSVGDKFAIGLSYSLTKEKYGKMEVFRVETFKDICVVK